MMFEDTDTGNAWGSIARGTRMHNVQNGFGC